MYMLGVLGLIVDDYLERRNEWIVFRVTRVLVAMMGCVFMLATSIGLSDDWNFQQFIDEGDIFPFLIQISKNSTNSSEAAQEEGNKNDSFFYLQKFSLTTGEIQKLAEVPVCKNYHGKKITPSSFLCSSDQKFAVVLL